MNTSYEFWMLYWNLEDFRVNLELYNLDNELKNGR